MTSNRIVELHYIFHEKIKEYKRKRLRSEAVDAHHENYVANMQKDGQDWETITKDEWFKAMSIMLADYKSNQDEVESREGLWDCRDINKVELAQFADYMVRVEAMESSWALSKNGAAVNESEDRAAANGSENGAVANGSKNGAAANGFENGAVANGLENGAVANGYTLPHTNTRVPSTHAHTISYTHKIIT